MKYRLLLIASFVSLIVTAQDFVVQNVTLFDGAAVFENISVLVENGKIAQVGKNIKTNVEVIDGTDKFLMPSLSNAHVHAFSALTLKEAANAGVLQVFDMHGMEQYQQLMQDNMNAKPDFADYYFAGSAATVEGGHGTQFGFEVPTLSTPEEAPSFVSDRIAAGADYIKIIVEPWKATLDKPTVSALINEAHKAEVPAVVHISRWEDAQFVLNEKADGLVHIWWDQKADKAALEELIATTNFFVIPTLLTSHLALKDIREMSPEESYLSDDEISAEVKKLYDAGVILLTGTDPPNAGINYGTDLYKEMKLLADAGIPNIEVLRAATSNVSTYFKILDTGFITKGQKAHMLLLNENPLDDIENIKTIHTIWKSGQKVPRD